MNVPDAAPELLHRNPETEPGDISDLFANLYRQARRHFCSRVLTSPYVDPIWKAAMRRKWTPGENSPIGYEDRFAEIARAVWREVRPPAEQALRFAEEDPSLLSVHRGLTHTFGPDLKGTPPEQIVLHNLELWLTESLSWFWHHRLDGEKMAVFNVRSQSIELDGIVPKEMLLKRAEAPRDDHFQE